MTLLDVLMDEHRGFTTMLDVLDAIARRMSDGKSVPAAMVAGALDFFEHFTDGHHRQEETLLFPLLAAHGLGRDETVINALLVQHEAGRAYTARMRRDESRMAAGDPLAAEQFAADARGYVELIREHIRIEDNYFYKLASQILTPAEQAAMTEAFGRARSHSVSDGQRERYLQMLSEYPAIVASWQR